ncbi:type VII secretion integral membrane protein EccD [Nocardioides sp. W7]|uniref:type VII secretion integral membrane protein EccD n=1 Tax=Nocardioides sp. W7 TaxID=2931390 RepID=UPI001FD3B575|nr:type VII secretion integral membrane protein EccD [Nocardioides sp. W7]
MTRSPVAGPADLLRVTVTSAGRRVDLVLPGSVPVAELLPELARSVGLLDARTVHGGYQLMTAAGRTLSPEGGLVVQGVEDGGLLAVSAGIDDEPPRVYDDVAEAMADVVESDLRPWSSEAGRRTALGAAVLLMVLGAVALLMQRGSPTAAVAAALAGVVAVVLLGTAVVLSRVRRDREAAVALAWTSTSYAAASGVLPTDGELFGQPLAGAGAAVLLTGLLALAGLEEGRPLLIPPVVVGAVALATGVPVHVADVDGAVVLTTTLVVVVLMGSVLPWLALSATGTGAGAEPRHAAEVDLLRVRATGTGAGAEPRHAAEVDLLRVRTDARLAHELLVASSGAVGLVLVLVLPLAVRLGAAGTLLALVACGLVMLRTRQHRTGAEVRVGLLSGVLGLVVVAVSVLAWWPGWRPITAAALLAVGAVLLAATLLPARSPVRRGRLGDVAETLGLLALLPLLVLATGLPSSVGP